MKLSQYIQRSNSNIRRYVYPGGGAWGEEPAEFTAAELIDFIKFMGADFKIVDVHPAHGGPRRDENGERTPFYYVESGAIWIHDGYGGEKVLIPA